MRKFHLISKYSIPFLTLLLISISLFFAPRVLYGGASELSSRQVLQPAQAQATHNIQLSAGWNTISSYIEPDNPQLDVLFSAINADLVLLKNGEGQVYWPSENIDQVGSWQANDGYQVYMNNPATLSISGTQISWTDTFPDLFPGWSLIAYHSDSASAISTSLAGYGSDLTMVKNGAGEVYWPEFNVNQINNLQPGQGYWIRLLAGTAEPNVAPQIKTGEIAFSKKILSTTMWGTHAVIAGDLDRDGDMDAATTNYGSGHVTWFQNDGSGNFTQKGVDTNFEYAYPISVGDVNLDGHPDILAGNYIGNAFRWYRNEGGGNFTMFVIDDNSAGAHSIVTGDLDEDGDNDLVTASEDADVVAWYENDGNENFTLHVVDNTADKAKRAEIADINGDGDLDIVAGNFNTKEVVWYENDGNENFSKRVISTNQRGVYYVFPADINGDQKIDVFGALERGSKITWYRNNGNNSWTRFVIDENSLNPRTVIGDDIDLDGDVDAIAASVSDNTVAWYENDGSGNFSKHIIDQSGTSPYGVFTIDMDFDGDVDVLSAQRDSNETSLHTHYKAHTISVPVGGTRLINPSRLLTEDVDDGPTELTYTLITVPQRGNIKLGGSNLPTGGTFTQADINNALVTYVHNGGNSDDDGFTFTVADGGESGVQPAGGTFDIIVNN